MTQFFLFLYKHFCVVSTQTQIFLSQFSRRDKKILFAISLENMCIVYVFMINDLSILNKFTQNASFLASITRYNELYFIFQKTFFTIFFTLSFVIFAAVEVCMCHTFFFPHHTTNRHTFTSPYKSGRVFFTPSILHTSYTNVCTLSNNQLLELQVCTERTRILFAIHSKFTFHKAYVPCVYMPLVHAMSLLKQIVNVVEWKRRRIYLIFPSSFHIVFDGYRSWNVCRLVCSLCMQ